MKERNGWLGLVGWDFGWLGLHQPLIILLMVCSEARAKKIEIKICHLKQKTEILLKTTIQTFIIFLSRP